MTRRARSGRGWDAAPPRAPRRRPSPEDGAATATTPGDDLWAADPEASPAPPTRRTGRTGLFRASDLRSPTTAAGNGPSDPDTEPSHSAKSDPDTGRGRRQRHDQAGKSGQDRPAVRRIAFDAPIGSAHGAYDAPPIGHRAGAAPTDRRRDDPYGVDDPYGTARTGRRKERSARLEGPPSGADAPRARRRRNTTDTPGKAPGEEAPGGAKPGDTKPRDPGEHAREICLRLLSVRPRTRAELAAALVKRGIPDGVVAEVLDRYDEVGIIDDAAFARAWVESRHHGKGLARRALRQELRRKGVEQDVIADALLEIEPETEEVTARELVERKLRTTRGEPDAVFRRLVGMLARKGYPPGVAVRAVKDVLEQRGFEQDFSEQAGADWADALEAEAIQAEGERPDRV